AVVAPVVATVDNTTEISQEALVDDIQEVVISEEESEDESEEEPLVEAIICTQCGSADIDFISEELGKCNSCGTQVVLNRKQETNYVTNNITVNMDGNGLDEPINFFELPKEIDEKAYYARALTKIALDKTSPEDIFIVGKFDAVKTVYRQYAIGKGTAEMTFTATVGYDRKEQYQTTANKRLQEGDYYTYKGVTKRADRSGTFTVDVVKERTVTDWQPFSGNHIGEYFNSTSNDDNASFFDANDYLNYCASKAIVYDASTSKAPTPLAPSSSAIDSLKSGIKSLAEHDCEKKLPGDRHKNFSCNGVATLSLLESHVAPQYILNYTYLANKYTSKAHSLKNAIIYDEIPSAKDEIENEIEQNKLVKTFNILTFVVLLFSILSAIIFPVALKITFAVVGLALFITSCIIRSNVSKNIYNEKQLKKKQSLIAHLKKKGIDIPKELKEVQ
ncbi:MAG: hypothetical protein J6R88_05400, partial [Clostridia bacterium]|nr:hypothetical protein [Clostridia bacterium]